MIWVAAFFIIILVSAVMAFRSMRDYEEFPENLSLNTVFFLGNPQAFTEQTLDKLHGLFLERKHLFSLERLIKGKEKALVLFGPKELAGFLPELNLVELEDYLGELDSDITGLNPEKRVSVNQTVTWLIEPKNNAKRQLHLGTQLKELSIGDQQKVFIQVVGEPQKDKEGEYFQSTLRIIVADTDPIERVNLAKKVNQAFTDATGLNKHEDNFPEVKKFESFKKRTLIPKEVADFKLTAQEIFDVII
jgi:hypothetical protein